MRLSVYYNTPKAAFAERVLECGLPPLPVQTDEEGDFHGRARGEASMAREAVSASSLVHIQRRQGGLAQARLSRSDELGQKL